MFFHTATLYESAKQIYLPATTNNSVVDWLQRLSHQLQFPIMKALEQIWISMALTIILHS